MSIPLPDRDDKRPMHLHANEHRICPTHCMYTDCDLETSYRKPFTRLGAHRCSRFPLSCVAIATCDRRQPPFTGNRGNCQMIRDRPKAPLHFAILASLQRHLPRSTHKQYKPADHRIMDTLQHRRLALDSWASPIWTSDLQNAS